MTDGWIMDDFGDGSDLPDDFGTDLALHCASTAPDHDLDHRVIAQLVEERDEARTALAEAIALAEVGLEAWRLTREYWCPDLLPEVDGWTWHEWCKSARAFLAAQEATDD